MNEKKIERFYLKLEQEKKGITLKNGEYGYIVTIGELIKNGGRNEYFRKIRGNRISKDVYAILLYDCSDKRYYAECCTDSCKFSGPLTKESLVFIGFTF